MVEQLKRLMGLTPEVEEGAVCGKALEAAKNNGMRRSYWDWQEMVEINGKGYFPYTPVTNMLYGLVEAIDMLHEEGLDTVFARHQRLAAATRAALTSGPPATNRSDGCKAGSGVYTPVST